MTGIQTSVVFSVWWQGKDKHKLKVLTIILTRRKHKVIKQRINCTKIVVYNEGGKDLFSWAVWHSCRMGARNQEQTRGRIGPQLRLGNLRVGELHFCPLCTALDQASSLNRKLAYVPGPTFGFVKLLASSGSHCTKWADEQHWQAGFESRLVPDLPLPFIPTLIGLRAFDLVSSRVWWEAATNIGYQVISVVVVVVDEAVL